MVSTECALYHYQFRTIIIRGVLPWKLPKREQDGEFVVELLKFIKSAKDKLRLILTFSQDPHHICLDTRDKEGDSHSMTHQPFHTCDGAGKCDSAGLT